MNIDYCILSSDDNVTNLITSFIHKFSCFNCIGIYSNHNQIVSSIYEYNIKLLFVYIDDKDNIRFCKTLKSDLQIVCISNESCLAVECFRMNALDFILISDINKVFYDVINKVFKHFLTPHKDESYISSTNKDIYILEIW